MHESLGSLLSLCVCLSGLVVLSLTAGAGVVLVAIDVQLQLRA